MKREACMLELRYGMLDTLKNGIRDYKMAIENRLEKIGAKNASIWSVNGFAYVYAEFDDKSAYSLKDFISPFEYDLMYVSQYVAKPGEMRLMYHDIGCVHKDKAEIRRRVFATKLKPNCAEEYKARHQRLIDARENEGVDHAESNFTIWCAKDTYIFGYAEMVRAFDHEMTEEEKKSTIEWETKQLEIMDWFTDDVDWITGEKHDKMEKLFVQKGYEG